MLQARSFPALSFVLVVLHAACSGDESAVGGGNDSCRNGIRDRDETAVDCGGICGKCSGDECTGPADCASGSCENGACRAAGPDHSSANDGHKNNGETDIDCGGPSAPPCAEGRHCDVDADCADKYCKPDAKRCAVPRNDDGLKNGTETDVDCGGQSGKTCPEGSTCIVDSDCSGACNYQNKCVDARSCRPHFGGDTCGGKPLHAGEFGDTAHDAKHESCCRSLPVPGYSDPMNPGKTVFVDKYEITAGRVRAFIEAVAAANNGQPDIKGWIAANTPSIWNESWNPFLPSGTNTADITVPRQPSNPAEPKPWNRNVGTDSVFGSPLYIYVHGHNCGNLPDSYGYPTFWYPDAVLTGRGEVARASGFDGNGGMIPPKEVLDVKSMTCIPSAILAAFCHWDGGQLATDEVLDYITDAPANLGNAAGCGSRCAPLDAIQYSGDSGSDTKILYRFPFYPNTAKHEGAARIATPGRVFTDVVRLHPGDEPWMDLHGNVHEVVLDINGATFTGNFGLKYRGIGTNSARAGGNNGPPGKYTFPEYKAGYSGGRCMRFK